MKTYQPKVNSTKQYSDSQGEHVVHLGKLLLLNVTREDILEGNYLEYHHDNEGAPDVFIYKPIIISETEEIEVEDYIFNTRYPERGIEEVKYINDVSGMGNFSGNNNGRFTYTTIGYGNYFGTNNVCVKILALPKHFSDKHLQAIVDGKMKDGDKVLIKCKHRSIKTGRDLIGHTPAGEPTYIGNYNTWNEVHLDQQNHITLFPVRESLKEASKKYYNQHVYKYLKAKDPSDTLEEMSLSDLNLEINCAIEFGAEWAKNNNYK